MFSRIHEPVRCGYGFCVALWGSAASRGRSETREEEPPAAVLAVFLG